MAVYSHSRLATYESCPLQYRLRYIDEVDIKRRETIESFLGRRVHETLQYLYDRRAEGALLTLTELVTHLHNSWDREWHDKVKLIRTDATLADYRATAVRCVANYYRANHPFTHGQTLGSEVPVVFVLDGSRDIHIKGYIDRLVRLAPGVYEIHDYKTSRRIPRQEEIDRDRQLALYQMAVHRMMGDAHHVRLVWHYLLYGRKLRSWRSPEALEDLRQGTLSLIDRIEDATLRSDFPAARSRLCDWCDYRAVCPEWNPVQLKFEFTVTAPAKSECAATPDPAEGPAAVGASLDETGAAV